MPYKEPYWARYVKSWKKPPKYTPGKIKTKPLKHCSACTWPCNYIGCDEWERSLCPYYNLQ